MAQTIYIGDNSATSVSKVIFSEQDFVNLVYEYMGGDARNYLEQILEQRNETTRELNEVTRELDEIKSPWSSTIYDGGWNDGYESGYQEGLGAAPEE